MDAKISKQRLANLLSYEWIKILVSIAVSITALIVLFTAIGTRPTDGQTMYFVYTEEVLKGVDENSFEDVLIREKAENSVFSSEVFATTSLFLSTNRRYAGMALAMRDAAGQESIAVTSTRESGEGTYLQIFVDKHYPLMEKMDVYFADAENYFSAYYNEEGVLNEEYLELAFRARAKGDKRYRTEKKILLGIEEEKERIQQTYESYLAVKDALEKGILSFKATAPTPSQGEEEDLTAYYSLDFSSKNFTSLTRLIYLEDENGVQSNEGLQVCFFTLSDDQQYMRFEKLNYIAYLLKTYAVSL